jgi:callose synthase
VWICVDEWQNFLERIQLIENTLRRTVDQKKSEKHDETVMDLRLWASYRGQTLARTGIHQIFNMILKYA